MEPRWSPYGNLRDIHAVKVTSRRPRDDSLNVGSIVIRLKLDIPTTLFTGRDFQTELVIAPELVHQYDPTVTQEDASP